MRAGFEVTLDASKATNDRGRFSSAAAFGDVTVSRASSVRETTQQRARDTKQLKSISFVGRLCVAPSRKLTSVRNSPG
jgi:hypothetical protein